VETATKKPTVVLKRKHKKIQVFARKKIIIRNFEDIHKAILYPNCVKGSGQQYTGW
jgi:hypothetical protein